MAATVLPIGEPTALRLAVEAIQSGEIIAFPTDTVYGVGGDLGQAAAIAAIYGLKGRTRERALPVLLASAAQLSAVARAIPDGTWQLIEAFWPGALTIVVPRHPAVPDLVGSGSQTIGVRVPAHRDLLRLLESARVPLASSSANLSGQPSAIGAEEVAASFGAGVRLILDGGTLAQSAPSTVLDMTRDVPTILRTGAVPVAEIARVLGKPPIVAAR